MPCHVQKASLNHRQHQNARSVHHKDWGHLRGRCGKIWKDVSSLDYIMQFQAGWWLGHPSEKIWTSIGMMKFPIYGKIKNVPNHQPARVSWKCIDMSHSAGLATQRFLATLVVQSTRYSLLVALLVFPHKNVQETFKTLTKNNCFDNLNC